MKIETMKTEKKTKMKRLRLKEEKQNDTSYRVISKFDGIDLYAHVHVQTYFQFNARKY